MKRMILIVLFYFGLVFSQSQISKTIFFSNSPIAQNETICITTNPILADETICITTNPILADETYYLGEDPSKAEKVIEVVDSPTEASHIISIKPNPVLADKTICITTHSILANETIAITELQVLADESISILNATPKEEEVILALMHLKMLRVETTEDGMWATFEESTIKGKISGSLKNGHIFETVSGNFYQITESVYLYEYELRPDVVVLQNGPKYKLIIDGIEEPILCEMLNESVNDVVGEVIKSSVDGDFEGFEGDTIIRLLNGQIWRQTEYYYEYTYSFMPAVTIFKSDAGFKMKVDGIDKAVSVEKLN